MMQRPVYKRSAITTYGLALISVGAMLLIRLAAWPLLEAEAPFLFFVAAVVFSAWYGGFGPGVFATLLSSVLVDYYFLPPFYSLGPVKASQVVWLTSYILIGILMSWLMETLHLARIKSEEAVRETELRAADVDRLNKALYAADRRKNEFLAMLSHELRNPLSAILHAITVLRLSGPADPVLQRARDTAERQVKNMARLLDDLLDVSRATLGKFELQRQTVDLATIVRRVMETSRSLVERGEKSLSLSIAPAPFVLDADPVRIEQVFNNLLDNAAKYTPAGGHVWVNLAREADEAVVSVRDDGIGMSPELLANVFDVFVQGDRSIDRSQGGLGIGLALVRSIVEMHGGHVEARSGGPGEGSDFVVRLPLRRADETVPSQGGAAKPSGVRRKILVVEDNVDSAEMLGHVLKTEGHEVEVVHDGTSAMERAVEDRPDVILMDIGLPGLSGYELADRLRHEPLLANVRLIAVTGYGQHGDVQKSREAGFHHHLTKPVDLEALRRALV